MTLVGSWRLAALAEAELTGAPGADADILAEIAPCFVAEEGGRTDVVVLACTHYPLLLPRFERLAPWPVTWIDPAPAIARRVVQLIGETPEGAVERGDDAVAVFTDGGAVTAALRRAFAGRGLSDASVVPIPLAPG